jgi:hypothetical protein
MGRDVLRDCAAPTVRGLMARGASTLSALTTDTAKTLPSHTAMLTGCAPEKHGVHWNDAFRGHPKVPTLFEALKRSRPRLTTAMVAGKAKFATFARPARSTGPSCPARTRRSRTGCWRRRRWTCCASTGRTC